MSVVLQNSNGHSLKPLRRHAFTLVEIVVAIVVLVIEDDIDLTVGVPIGDIQIAIQVRTLVCIEIAVFVDHSDQQRPDIVIHVIDSSNLERNLYLLTELLDLGVRVVIALNMYDELLRSKAMLQVREESAHLIDLQIVAFPQEGIESYANGRELMEEAIRLGADVVGGIPHFEYTRDQGVSSVKFLMDPLRKMSCQPAPCRALTVSSG